MQQQTTAKESCNNKHQPGTTLDPICQIMLIPVGRFCSISWRMYFLCNFLHRFGVSTHFSYTCRKGPKKRTSGPNSGQIFMRLSLKALFRITFLISFSASQCFLVPTNQSPRIFLLLHDKQQMTRQFLCQKQWFWELKWTVIGWWNQKNAIRIYAKYTQDTIFLKCEMVSTQMSGMWAGLDGIRKSYSLTFCLLSFWGFHLSLSLVFGYHSRSLYSCCYPLR